MEKNNAEPDLQQLFSQYNKKTRLIVSFSVIVLIIFLSAAAVLPFKDIFFGYLYSKPSSQAAENFREKDIPSNQSKGPSLNVTPSTIKVGDYVTVSWSGIADPADNDFIVLYPKGVSNGRPQVYMYVSCSQTPTVAKEAGSCPIQIPSTAVGDFEFHLYGTKPALALLVISNQLTIKP